MSRANKGTKKIPGHYCWVCDTRLPNERFSGRGRRRHICQQCRRLGAQELEVRQHLRDIDRLVSHGLPLRRRDRPQLEKFLEHPIQRVADYARKIIELDLSERQQWRELQEQAELEQERYYARMDEEPANASTEAVILGYDDTDIPF